MSRKRKLDETAPEAADTTEAAEKQESGSGDEFEGFDEEDDDNDSIANLEVSDEESGAEED